MPHFQRLLTTLFLAFALIAPLGLLTSTPAGPTSALAAEPIWQEIWPSGPTRLWRSPHYLTDSTLYMATEQMLWRSTDRGDTWQPLYPTPYRPNTPGPCALAIDPDPGIHPSLFLSCGLSGEIYRSQDGAATWQRVFQDDDARVYDLAAGRDSWGRLVVFAVGEARVWRSTDGGENWAAASEGAPDSAEIYHVYLSPDYAHDQTIYLTGFGRLLRSTNGGDHWAELPIEGVDIARHVLFSPNYAADHTLWISYFFIEGDGINPPNGIVRSDDGGATWQFASDGLPIDWPDGWILGLSAAPDYPGDPSLYAVERVVHADVTAWELYRSTDRGESWRPQGTVTADTPQGLIAAEYDHLFVPTSAGLLRLHNADWQWLINGDAEENAGWVFYATPATAGYTYEQVHGGLRAIRAGIVGGPNGLAYSSARQSVPLPATADQATVTLWLYPVSTETLLARPVNTEAGYAPVSGDAQYVLLLDEDGEVLETLLWMLSDTAAWETHTFDVSAYIGRNITLLIGVYNDGDGGVTGLYLDDADLLAHEPSPVAPASQVVPLPTTTGQITFTVNWSGNATTGYDIQVRDGDLSSPWSDWLSATSDTSAAFTGQDGHTYTFRSRARGQSGQVEAWPTGNWADAFTTLRLDPAPVFITAAKMAQPTVAHVGDVIQFMISLPNTGNLDAAVVVTDTLPAFLELTAPPTINHPNPPVVVGNVIGWSGAIAAGQTHVRLAFATQVTDAPPNGIIVNTAMLSDGINPVWLRQATVQALHQLFVSISLHDRPATLP